MANEVFSNGLEVACKAAEGMSKVAFPDPCFTPPPPSGGWVLVPYANTALAKDLTNCSTTVFISGLPVAKKDVSFIKTSTGNEPAAGPKGQKTGVKKGKAYFTSWSMDVKVEGLNVCRHTDGMTHNHGSMSGNTGVWKYLDSSNRGDCAKDFRKVEIACGGMKKKKHGRNGARYVSVNKTVDWKKKHCGGLLNKPFDFKDLSKKDELINGIEKRLNNLGSVTDLIDEATDAAMNQIVEMGVRFGLKQVVKKVPVAGWIWQAATAVDDIKDVSYMKDLYDGALAETERMKKQVTSFSDDLKRLKENLLKTPPNTKGAQAQMSDWQRTAATTDKCTRARKCMLVPMEETDDRSKAKDKTKDEITKGCCPGQTGHHLIPGAFFEKSRGASGCSKYKYEKAPVVCAEGTTDTHGSHGAAHGAMNKAASKAMNASEMLSYEDARDAAIVSHAKTFPFSTCSRKCLQAQLDKYHKKDAGCDDSAQLKYKELGPAINRRRSM
jgi:hypothetical protein